MKTNITSFISKYAKFFAFTCGFRLAKINLSPFYGKNGNFYLITTHYYVQKSTLRPKNKKLKFEFL